MCSNVCNIGLLEMQLNNIDTSLLVNRYDFGSKLGEIEISNAC